METTRKPLPKYVIAIIAVAGALVLFLILYFAIPCKVTLNYSYNTWGGVKTDEIAVIRTSRYTPNVIPSRSGYRFAGWFVDSACTVPWISGDRVTHNITLHAKWEPVD